MTAPLDTRQTIRSLSQEGYKYGFITDIEADTAPPGLSEDTVRFISGKKSEPEWMLDWRLKAYRAWLEMEEVTWAKLDIPEIDYQGAYYYAAPKAKKELGFAIANVDAAAQNLADEVLQVAGEVERQGASRILDPGDDAPDIGVVRIGFNLHARRAQLAD